MSRDRTLYSLELFAFSFALGLAAESIDVLGTLAQPPGRHVSLSARCLDSDLDADRHGGLPAKKALFAAA